MAHEYEEGWVAHIPSWHELADVKEGERPASWEAAKTGYLNWEPEGFPIFRKDPENPRKFVKIPDYQGVMRNDNLDTLTVQPMSRAIIGNEEFGGIIEWVMGADIEGMPPLQFDTLSVLKGGRIVAVTLKLTEKIEIPGDDSLSIGYIHFWTRHDGKGGLKLGGGVTRIECANTQLMAEVFMDQAGLGMTIAHTKNWADRINLARQYMVGMLGQFGAWKEIAVGMAETAVDLKGVEWFMDNWLPTSTNMTELQVANVQKKREQFLNVYSSATCEAIRGTVYGLSQAAVEACDHFFPARSLDTRAQRVILSGSPDKVRALALAKRMV